MATFSLDELITPVTRQEVQAKFYEVYAILGLRTSSWKEGAVVRTMTTAASIVMAAFSQLQSKIARAGFLELSEGKWLDLVGHYVYGLDRIEATFATGMLTLVNGGGGVFELDPDDLIVKNPATNKSYRNTQPISLGSGETLSVPIRAIEAGYSSSAPANAITEMTTTLLQVTCTNALALTARDDETDPQYITRCLESVGALSPFGPWDAYASAVRNARRDDETTLGITRIRPVKDGYGNVDLYLASASGPILGDADDPETDLGIAHEAVQRNAVPLAVTANVLSAVALPIPVTYEVWMYNTSGRTQGEITDAIQARLQTFIASQPIAGNRIASDPGKVFHDALRAAIAATWPQIFHVVVTTPASDVVCGADDVPTLGSVTATAIHQIAPSEGVSV